MEKERRVLGKSVWLGAAASFGAYLLLLLLASYLTVSGRVGESMMPQCVWLCAGLASLLGALTAARGAGRSITPVLLGTAVFWVSVLILGFLASNALSLSSAAALLAASAAGALPVLLLTGQRGKRIKRHKTTRSRR